MSIEKELGRIADALETLVGSVVGTATGSTGKPEPQVRPAPQTTPDPLDLGNTAAPAEKPAASRTSKKSAGAAAPAATLAPGDTAPTKDDLVDQLRALVTAKGPEVAKKLLTKYGAGKISDLAEDKYAAFYKEMQDAAK